MVPNRESCAQEKSKKQAAEEMLGYSDTFIKVGFTGLSMKDSTPDEIGAVVGTVPNVKCISFFNQSATSVFTFFEVSWNRRPL